MRVRVNRALVLLREWSGVAALLLVLTGGVAYAANTIGSSDIIDGQVKTPDLAANAVNSSKIADGQVTEADIGQGAVATAELKNDVVSNQKVLNETLVGADVKDNALKGADIDESTLSSIGGGGPAGGDLSGSYPNPQIAPNSVGDGEVEDNSLTAADIVESSLDGVDADALDGLDSTAFMQGGGVADGQAIAEGPGANNFLGPAFGGFTRLQYQCPASLGSNGTLKILNASSGIANFFVDSGGANPDYFQLASGGFTSYPASAAGESFSIQAQGAPGVETIQVATVHRNGANDCHAQALGVLAG